MVHSIDWISRKFNSCRISEFSRLKTVMKKSFYLLPDVLCRVTTSFNLIKYYFKYCFPDSFDPLCGRSETAWASCDLMNMTVWGPLIYDHCYHLFEFYDWLYSFVSLFNYVKSWRFLKASFSVLSICKLSFLNCLPQLYPWQDYNDEGSLWLAFYDWWSLCKLLINNSHTKCYCSCISF